MQVVPGWPQFLLMQFAPGAFIVLGFFLAGMNGIQMRRARLQGKTYTVPAELGCAHCSICRLGEDKAP